MIGVDAARHLTLGVCEVCASWFPGGSSRLEAAEPDTLPSKYHNNIMTLVVEPRGVDPLTA